MKRLVCAGILKYNKIFIRQITSSFKLSCKLFCWQKVIFIHKITIKQCFIKLAIVEHTTFYCYLDSSVIICKIKCEAAS